MKSVIHHTTGEVEEFREILCWIAILLDKDVDKIAVVSHGNGINLLTKASANEERISLLEKEPARSADRGEWAVDFLVSETTREEKLQALMNQGVDFKGCETALSARGLDTEEMVDGLEVVPSGILEVNALQGDGYNYVTYPSQYGGIPEQYS